MTTRFHVTTVTFLTQVTGPSNIITGAVNCVTVGESFVWDSRVVPLSDHDPRPRDRSTGPRSINGTLSQWSRHFTSAIITVDGESQRHSH